MGFWNRKTKEDDINVSRTDVQALVNNPAWVALTSQWEKDAKDLSRLLMLAPKDEIRNDKGQLVMASFDNIRGQLDNLLAILASAKVLDESIQAEITQFNYEQEIKKQTKQPGGRKDV